MHNVNEELEALKAAMGAGDFDTARDLATNYVRAHPEEFTDYVRLVQEAPDERAAVKAVVQRVTAFRNLDMPGEQYRAEAFHLHRWHPQDVTGQVQPLIRNDLGDSQPAVRNHK